MPNRLEKRRANVSTRKEPNLVTVEVRGKHKSLSWGTDKDFRSQSTDLEHLQRDSQSLLRKRNDNRESH
jgi:hypothetical protein